MVNGCGHDRQPLLLTTIRAEARDAGIDLSMAMRYFGNKEQLFDAALALPCHPGHPPAGVARLPASNEPGARHLLTNGFGDELSGLNSGAVAAELRLHLFR